MRSRVGRREFLVRGVQVSVALLVGAGAIAETCGDPSTLSDSAKGLRESLEYTSASKDPSTVCAGCAFFKGDGACGACDMLGSEVDAKGHCTSWSAKS